MFYQFQHFSLSEYFCKEYGHNFSFPYHLHRCYELITVISGEMNVCIDGKDYMLHTGEAVLVFPNQLHSLQSETSEHMLCIFSPELVKAYYLKTVKKLPQNNKFILKSYFKDILNDVNSDSPLTEKKGILYLICSEFDKKAKYVDTYHREDNAIFGIFEFIESNYSNDCSLYNLSKQMGFSYSYLSRYFKNVTGISFNSYVNQYRITNACYLLKNTNSSVIQCSLDCGYMSLRSFNRNFKNIVGITPLEYKKSAM